MLNKNGFFFDINTLSAIISLSLTFYTHRALQNTKTKNKEINAVRRRKPKDSKKTNSCAYIVRVKTSYKNLTDTREREKGNIKKQTNKKYY